MTNPLSEPISRPSAPTSAAKRTPIARWARLLAVAGGVALALDAAVLGVLSLTRKPRPPVSPVFGSSPAIAQLQGMADEYPRDPKWHLGLGLTYHDNGHYLSAIDELQTSLRLGGPEPAIRETLAACDMK